MPLIYNGTCPRCGHREGASDSGMAFYREEDGAMLPLPHPCEDLRIKRYGTTLDRALREGRIVHSESRVCWSCGALNERRDLRVLALPTGWGDALIVLVATAVAAVVAGRAHWVLGGLMTLFGAYIVVGMMRTGLAKYRFRDAIRARRAALRPTRRCARCGGRWLLRVHPYLPIHGKLLCSSCGTRTVWMKLVGIS